MYSKLQGLMSFEVIYMLGTSDDDDDDLSSQARIIYGHNEQFSGGL